MTAAHNLRPGRFLAISLALHLAALLLVRHDPPATHWQAGPVIVKLTRLAGSPGESGTASSETAARPGATKPVSGERVITAAETIPPQPRPARIPAKLPAAVEKPHDNAAPAEPAQRRAAVSAATTAAREQQLLASLRTALMPHFSYPMLARRRGWEGIVRVGVRIEANGSLTRLRIVESCPYSVLNTAAINSLAQLAQLPNTGNLLQGSHVDLVLPIEYRLLEG